MKLIEGLQTSASEKQSNSDWGHVCRAGGVAAFILVAYTLATILQMILLGGQPSSAAEAFHLLQVNRFVGLLRLDLPTLFALPLYYLLFLGIYAALRRSVHAYAILGTALVFVGVTLTLATPGALSMIPLSDKFEAAQTDAAKSQLLAAGEAIMAADIWHGTGALIGGFLMQAGGILICVVLLRCTVVGRITAWIGIVAFSLDLAHIVLGPFVPVAGVVLMAIAGPLYPIWFFMVGRGLMRVGRADRTVGP